MMFLINLPVNWGRGRNTEEGVDTMEGTMILIQRYEHTSGYDTEYIKNDQALRYAEKIVRKITSLLKK